MFLSWMKRQTCDCQEDVETLFAKLQEMEASIDVIARGMSRQAKEGGH